MQDHNQPLLTVIVPCYNVEKYLDKCISSIVNQTYSNLEILLIDDGSPDSSGAICDTWQERDKRIRVIHKQNEGLTYARKTGVENASAEYVTFVDSDDWIAHDMYADMMSALLSTDSDIAECDLCYVYEDGRIEHRINERDASIKTMGRIEGVVSILENHTRRVSCVTKIFKRHLFDNVKFTKGRDYGEDMIVYQLFHHASQTVYLGNGYYFYFQRSDSICNNKSIPLELKKLREWSDVVCEYYYFIEQNSEYYGALRTAKCYVMCLYIRLLHCILTYPQQFASEYFSLIAKQLRSIPLDKGDRVPRNAGIELYLLKISPGLYKLVRTLYNQIILFTNKLKITNNRRTCMFINDPGFYWRSLFN